MNKNVKCKMCRRHEGESEKMQCVYSVWVPNGVNRGNAERKNLGNY